MTAPQSIFLWEGKVQLGDEPGIYGDAAYSGLSLKFPVTIANINTAAPVDDVITLNIYTNAVNIFGGYPGHKISVFGYSENPKGSYHWKETLLATVQMKDGATMTSIDVQITAFQQNSIYISLQIDIDTTVQPGLYDDFIVSKLDYATAKSAVYAKFGFQ
ncbi:hypothetical protein [Mucilaginibacter paludis]|uniref:Uncharacterized protein n=1 Tax=Mucilaginibacter paludis DSM 18603 TaxID=714943 RepID=H1Y456_9SPHI|nr:hypothetical protein [Mucilaginibacter paludis]EHQ24792.1 hypothetical protein Mucpa_0602 [Mucilaginibacter paludis DSM 18603]